jgi:hypothetical protein
MPDDLALAHFVVVTLVVLLLGTDEDAIHHPRMLRDRSRFHSILRNARSRW